MGTWRILPGGDVFVNHVPACSSGKRGWRRSCVGVTTTRETQDTSELGRPSRIGADGVQEAIELAPKIIYGAHRLLFHGTTCRCVCNHSLSLHSASVLCHKSA